MNRSLFLLPATAVAALLFLLPSGGSNAAEAAARRFTKFEAGKLHPVVAGRATHKTTSYVLDYSITNETGEARKPRLRLEVKTTDTGKTHGDAYDAAAFAAVARETKSASEPKSTLKLRSEDMAAGAKDSGLADFGNIDPNSDSFQVRVYGLYDPVFRDRFGKAWTENRVLVLTYSRRGDEFDRQNDPITLLSSIDEVEGETREVHPK